MDKAVRREIIIDTTDGGTGVTSFPIYSFGMSIRITVKSAKTLDDEGEAALGLWVEEQLFSNLPEGVGVEIEAYE